MDIGYWSTTILKKGLASSAVLWTGLHDSIKLSNKPQNEAIKMGAVLAVSEKVLDYYDGRDIDLYNPWKWLDDVTYNSIGYYLLNRFKINDKLGGVINNVSPLDPAINDMILTGTLMTGLQLEAEMIDNTPALSSSPLQYVVHPSRLLGY